MTDPQLLQQLAANPAGPAMAEIARRHVDLVYSAALRQVRDAHLAEDVTQAVFLVLARKASRLGADVKLSGWLYNTARLTAKNALRAERRRRRHEGAAGRLTMEAAMDVSMNTPADSADSSAAAWQSLAPHLDDAMAALNEHDRQLILWRYFENQTHQQTAAALGVSENTANRRLLRAADKLRRILTGKGVMLSAAALTPLIAAHAVKAAPVGLKIATAGAASASAVGLSKGTLTMMLTAKLKIAVVLAAVLLAAGSGTALVVKVIEPAKPVTPAATPPIAAIATDPSTPATLPAMIDPGSGVTQVARYALVIQPALADAVKKIATPLKSDSVKFETFTADSPALLRLLAGAINTPAIIDVKDDIQFRPRSTAGHGWVPESDLDYLDYGSSLSLGGRKVDFSADLNGKSSFVLGPQAVTATLNFNNAHAYILLPNAPDIHDGAVRFTGTFSPPTSVIALGHLGKSPRDVWIMIVWQCIASTPPRMPMIESWTHGTRRWIASQMNDVITEADDGMAWSKLAFAAQQQTPAVMEMKLADPPCLVRVVGVRRPGDHPFRAWDAAGRPVSIDGLKWSNWNITLKDNDLELHVVAEDPDLHKARQDSYLFDHPGHEPFSIPVWVASGLWKEIGTVGPDKPLKDGAVEFRFSDQQPMTGDNATVVSIDQDGDAGARYDVIAIDHAGKEIRTVDDGNRDFPEILFLLADPHASRSLSKGFEVPRSQIDHFAIIKRAVRSVTFDHVAAAPDLAIAKPAPVAAANPATRPAGLSPGSPEAMMNDLLDAVVAGDLARAKTFVTGSPEALTACDAEFGMMRTQRDLCAAAVKQFGEDDISRTIPELKTAEQGLAPMRQMRWTIHGDTAVPAGSENAPPQDHELKCVREQGVWKVVLPNDSAEDSLRSIRVADGMKTVLSNLQAGKFKYVEELADAVHQAENPPAKP